MALEIEEIIRRLKSILISIYFSKLPEVQALLHFECTQMQTPLQPIYELPVPVFPASTADVKAAVNESPAPTVSATATLGVS